MPTKNQNADMDDSRLGGIFRIQSWSKVGEGHEEGAFYGEPTLRLDVEKIEVFRIKAVSYQKSKRSVFRYRKSDGEKLPF